MMKSNNFVRKKVFKNTKANLVMTLRFSAIISFILLILYVFCALFLSSILSTSYSIMEIALAIIFLILVTYILEPFYYSYFAMTVLLNSQSKDDVRMTGYFRTLRIGLKKQIMRSLSLPTTLIYSAIIFLSVNLISGVVIYEVLSVTNESYKILFNEIYNFYLNGNVNDLNAYLLNNSEMLSTPLIYSQFISGLGAFYFFLHRVGIKTMRYFLVPFTRGEIPNSFSNYCFKQAIKNNKKYFYSNYYSISWIFIIVILIVFSGSYFFLYFLNVTSSFSILLLTSIVLTCLFILPFAPLLFTLYAMMIDKFGAMYNSVLNNRFTEEMKNLKMHYKELSEDEKKQINNILSARPDFKKIYDDIQLEKDQDKSKLSNNDNKKNDSNASSDDTIKNNDETKSSKENDDHKDE